MIQNLQRDFAILTRSSISLFDIIRVVLCEVEEEEWRQPDPNIFLCIPASAADAAAVNPRGINTLLANGVITLLINGNPVFSNGSSNVPKHPPDCIIFDNCVSENLILADELVLLILLLILSMPYKC